jgi:hypothetical protein
MKTKSFTSWSTPILFVALLIFVFIPMVTRADTTILSEGFETYGSGGFSTAWSVGDSNPAGPTGDALTYWWPCGTSFSSVAAHSGSWKCYCAGYRYAGSNLSPQYQYSMNGYMSRSINLSGYAKAQLVFWVNIPSIEGCCDYLRVKVDSTEIWRRGTATSGWIAITNDLTAYAGGTHTLTFEFVSDTSVQYEGAWIDDITVSATTPPEITVLGGGIVSISDGDTTPTPTDGTDFGTITQGGSTASSTFTVRNDGGSTLTLGAVSVPSGFTLTEGLSTSLAPSASDTFTVRLDSTTAGTKTGDISFSNNDSDENPYNFRITGTVITSLNAPALLLPADGATMSANVAQIFQCGTVSGATGYKIQFDGTGFNPMNANQQFSLVTSATGPHTWRCCATNATGDGPWSATRSFTVTNNHNYWTIMVYMMGDNNLSNKVDVDLNSMEDAVLTNNTVVVMADYGGTTGAKRGKIIHDADTGHVTSPLTNLGSINMGNPSTLSNFIQWSVSAYPADHYALVLWDHGGGLYGVGSGENLYPKQIRQAITDSGIHLDIVTFDACLMGMAEVAYELRDVADYMTASEQLSHKFDVFGFFPYYSFPYKDIFGQINASPNINPHDLACAIVSKYGNSFINIVYPIGLTQSAIDLSKMGALGSSLNSLASAVIQNATQADWDTIRWIIEWQQTYDQFLVFGEPPYNDYRDLAEFLTSLGGAGLPSAVSSAAMAANISVTNAVIAEWHAANGFGQGLSAYLPNRGNMVDGVYNANNFQLMSDNKWGLFVSGLTQNNVPYVSSIQFSNPIDNDNDGYVSDVTMEVTMASNASGDAYVNVISGSATLGGPVYVIVSGGSGSTISIPISADKASLTHGSYDLILEVWDGNQNNILEVVTKNSFPQLNQRAFELTSEDTAQARVAMPTITPDGGTYLNSVAVQIQCNTAGATIRYTTNGVDPTSSSAIYTGLFTLTNSATVKAKAFLTGYADSAIASASFVLRSGTRIIGISGDLAFGTVGVGSVGTRTMTITNSGNSKLTVSGITWPPGFSSDWTAGYIAPVSSRLVQVNFLPTSVGSYGGTVTVNSDATSGNSSITISGTGSTTSPLTGFLQVNLEPSGAVNAGAQWQVDNDGVWRSNGTTIPGLSVGSHTVTFKPVSGWTTPSSQTPTISANSTTTITGTYGTRRIAIVNPDNNRILKLGNLNDSGTYYSIASGSIADGKDFSNPTNWTGVGAFPDFIGSALQSAGYNVDYFDATNLPAVSVTNYSVLIIQDPLRTNVRTFPRSAETNLPDVLEYVTNATFLGKITNYVNSGGSVVLVGDAVRLLENGNGRLNYGKTVSAYSVTNSVTTSVSDSGLVMPRHWLFIRGNPFCGVDRSGSGSYDVSSNSLISAGSRLQDITLFDGNDLPALLAWSESVYAPTDGVSLLDVKISGTGQYVLTGSTCSPPVYQDTVADTERNFFGYTMVNGHAIYYVGSDAFFDYAYTNYDGASHASQWRSIQNQVSSAGKAALVSFVNIAAMQAMPAKISLVPSGVNFVISWPTNVAGLVLKSKSSLSAPGPWLSIITNPPMVNGQYQTTIPRTNTTQFYRLEK